MLYLSAMSDSILGRRVTVGSIVEIRPGYDMDTGICDRWDEYTACQATVTQDQGTDLEVEIKGTGDLVWISRSRLRWLGGDSN